MSLWASTACAWAVTGRPVQDSPKAQKHAVRGVCSLEAGDLKSAEAELRQAVSLAPRNPTYLGSLGAVLGMEEKLEESSTYLEQALRINPSDLASRRNLASNQFQLGQLQPAKENLERVLKAAPGDKTSILLLGMVSEELKDYAAAVKWLASVPDQVRQRPKSIAALARAYYNTGQKERARETLKGLEGHPAGPEGIFLGAQVASQENDLDTAQRMFASIWPTYPDTEKLGYNLALVQYRANRIDESQMTLRKLVGAGHETSDIYNLLGWCLYKQGNFKEAVAAMDKAIEIDPTRESNYLDVGMILIEIRRPTGALVAAQRAVEVAPDSYQAYRLKGLAETKLARVTEAEKSFARALELNPADPETILGLASAQWDDGKIPQAEETLKKGLERCPHYPLLYQEYGKILLKLGSASDPSTESRAVSLLRTAIALDGSLAEPHHQLGKLALAQGRIQEALEELETAGKLDPENSEIHYSLARTYRRWGRGEEAAREFRVYESLKAEEEKSVSGRATRRNKPTSPEKELTPSALSKGPSQD